MSIEIDSEQGVCSVEIEGSRHRAPVDSLRIGTDARRACRCSTSTASACTSARKTPSGWWSPAPRTSAGT